MSRPWRLFAPAAALQPVLDGSLSLDEEFDAWAKHYGKAYTNAGHRSARKAIYAHARAFVLDHNQVRRCKGSQRARR